MQTDFQKDVFLVCSKIPKGRVSTYSEVARAMGKYGAARAVGNALNKNRSSSVPCHRVVCSDGSIGGFAHGSGRKAILLKSEGVRIKNGFVVDFKKIVKRF